MWSRCASTPDDDDVNHDTSPAAVYRTEFHNMGYSPLKQLCLTLCVFAFPTAPASATEDNTEAPPRLDEIVVTAGRTGDPLRNFGGAFVDRESIEILQPISALDLLDRTPGVRAFEKGGTGGASYLSIRGGEPNFTLVLLDGIRVNDPMNSRGGAFDFGQIDPLALEGIEVAKGALSAVHGADALSGAVNLRLRRLEEEERLIAARATADTQGGAGGSAAIGSGWQSGDFLVSGSMYRNDSDTEDFTDSSDLEREQLFGRINQELAGLRLSTLALRANSDRRLFPEDSGGPRLAVVRDRETRDTALALVGANIARADSEADWQPELSLEWVRQDDNASTPPIAPGPTTDGVPAIAADSRFERREVTVANRLLVGQATEVAVGASVLREKGQATGSIDMGVPLPADFVIERDMIGGFAELSVRPEDWVLATLGARYDDPSTEQDEWTGRAALRFEPFVEAPALFLSWSEGFKLPSLYALAYPIIANPDLAPERSESYEIGLDTSWAGERGRARLSWFHSRYTDLIDFDPQLFTNVNRSRVTVQGVEAEAAAPLSDTFGLSGNVTYLQADQPVDAPPLRSRPEWQGVVSLDWRPHNRLDVFFSAAYTSAFFDSSVPTGLVTLEDRTEITAAATFRFNSAVSITVTGENVLSDSYENAIGFPAPERVIKASFAIGI